MGYMGLKNIKTKIINKLNKDWEWDFGISFTDALDKFNNTKFVIYTKRVFMTIFAIFWAGLLSVSLCILFLAYPVLVAILLVLDLMLVVIVYYEYNGLMEGVKQCITDTVKNARLKKIKH